VSAGSLSGALPRPTTHSPGDRSKYLTLLYTLWEASTGVGPLLAACLFAVTGNEWHLGTLRCVMLVGMAIGLVPAACYFFFDDDKSLGKESDAVQVLLADEGGTSGERLRFVLVWCRSVCVAG
jgi:hypothetical protein